MCRAGTILTLALIAFAAVSLRGPGRISAQRAISQTAAAGILAVPDPVGVSMQAASTALLAIDFLDSGCGPSPACSATLPAVAAGLAAARSANALVVYSVHPAPDQNILPDVAPMPGEPIFAAIPGDKFFNSDLDDILKRAGIATLIVTGWTSNGGVLYTAAAATQRGYTVVVTEDAIAASTDIATSVALWQLLHSAGSNMQNAPLQPKAVTLSRLDLISYR